MNSYLRLDGVELWQVAGWTMVHFLWIGALIGAVAAGCGVVLRRASPNARYVAAAASLAALTALPLLIAGWLIQDLKRNVRLESSIAAGGTVAEFAPLHIVNSETSERLYNHTAMRSQTAPAAAGSAGGLSVGGEGYAGLDPRQTRGLPSELRTWQFASIANLLVSCITYLPWIWFVGTPVTLVLLATGIVGTERLRRAGEPITVGPIVEMGARLRTSLRVGRRVTIAVCERIAAPVLVGILRPMILLPPAALSGWSPDEIEMVLLHELAHVRRWDNLVNLLQRLVESLLFFHPAVWLVSGWMRREREACCDAIVVGHTNRPRAYAELLVSLASQQSDAGRPRPRLIPTILRRRCGRGRGRPGSLASAMAAGPLRNRIRYILQLEDDSMLVTGKSFALVLAGLLTAAMLAVLYLPTQGQAEESATEVTEGSKEKSTDEKDMVEKVKSEESPTDFLDGYKIEPGEQTSIVLRHPVSADEVSRVVRALNKQGHNVSIRGASGATLLITNEPRRKKSRFPTLEEQKLADLAWRMLQLELEPIGAEDLDRVKALGYNGGVNVTGIAQSSRGFREQGNFYEIQRGDILVGLHVWPTTSLEEVADILTRDDLASLSPLKFYVVRADQSDTDKGHVVTGRITVRTQATQASGGGSIAEAATVEFRGQASPEPTVEPRAANVPRDNWPAVASENEIKVLEEHIKTLQSQFERIDALFKAGRRGGNASTRALAAYELAVAKGEQALMQGQHAQAIERFNEAQAQAEDAFKAMSADYEAGNTTYDVVLLTSKNLADIKRKIIHLEQQRTSSTRAAADPTGGTRESDNPFSRSSSLDATPQSNESISVLKKFVEREKQQYERLAELAANNTVSAAEAATQKSNYEISLARLQQAQRALEYHKTMVALAAAEYETALEASKKAPRAVSESELRKLQLKVQAAEARFKELAE
jgi:hypothetical protein